MIRRLPLISMILVAVLFLASVPSTFAADSSQGSSVYGGNFLLDRGNGDTKWIEIVPGATMKDVVDASLEKAKIPHSYSKSYTIEGKTSTTIGSDKPGGSFSQTGTTGVTTYSSWHVFMWSSGSKEWSEVENPLCDYTDRVVAVAVGFYPNGVVPVETPKYKSSWTMIEADAENSANQTATLFTETQSKTWYHKDSACHTSALYVRGHVIVKYCLSAEVVSYSATDGLEEWRFTYSQNLPNELSTALIVGQYIYVQSSNGQIYRFSWADGPGRDYCGVTTFDEKQWGDTTTIPNETATLKGRSVYGQGPNSMVYDSGSIYVKATNGMVYCFNMDLKLQWSYQMSGGVVASTPTVTDNYVATGACDGCLYILDKTDGSPVSKQQVYFKQDDRGIFHGSVGNPLFVRSEPGYVVFVPYSDGLGMGSKHSGVAVYSFDGKELRPIKKFEGTLGQVSQYMTRYVTDNFKGVIVSTNNGLYKIDTEGNSTLVSNITSSPLESHTAPTLVNNSLLFTSIYDSKAYLFTVDLNGNVTGQITSPIPQYCMAAVTVVDDLILFPNDAGISAIYGRLPEYAPTTFDTGITTGQLIIYLVVAVVAAIAAFWFIMCFVFKWKKPFTEARCRVYTYFYGENYSHNIKSKRKLHLIVLFGLMLTFVVCMLSLCVGDKTTLGPVEALKDLYNAFAKGGIGLTNDEYLVYVNRMPRILAALGAGIGLSVAGAMYQAVIKNPLVEPYIMGVSAGAGTLVIAVVTFDFTLFGFLASGNVFITAVAAIIGGLLAFACTMILAEKTGGKSVNYVLAGIVVGLLFSAAQSLMIVKAGNKITSALSWLYGSFTSIMWTEAWIVLVACITLSLIPIIWAKEFNLVLLGEDQAQQMGLDARKFDCVMLIFASVLTAFCVAFCGIIGFVGLVIPHLSRMIVGGDHRMMLPVSIALGGFMLVLADFLARVLVSGFELPVGAITAFVGVPVFAYLLIKRGRSYDV